MERPVKLSPVYGIAIAVISIVFTIIFYVTDLYSNLWTGYFVHLVLFLGVLVSIIHYNRLHHDRTSVMSSFAMGLRTTLLAVIIVSVFSIVFHLITEATPGHTMVAESGNDTQDSDTVRSGFWIYLFGNVFFINLILGLLASLLGAMVFKTNQKTTSVK